jgi:hypothetical protein
VTAAPSDGDLRSALEEALGLPITNFSREPYPYATSAPLERLQLVLEDATVLDLIFKDLSWERLLDGGRGKPRFVHDPRRAIETHRAVLSAHDIGPRCVLAVHDDDKSWLVTERVPGVELWQVGDLRVWEEVAAWAAAFHARFAGRVSEVRTRNPYLIEHDRETVGRWARRAEAALRASLTPEAALLCDVIKGCAEATDAMTRLDHTFVHGEFYPSNVLVTRTEDDRVRVWPVDWEMAATGPAALDLAALITGWESAARATLLEAYHRATPLPVSLEELRWHVDLCRLHLALRWIGWAPGWHPPAEHAKDWVREALDAAAGLGL